MASMDIFYSIYGHDVLCNYAIQTSFLSSFQDTSAVANQALLQSVFLRLLSTKLQYSFDSVPKEDTSKVFQTGG